MRRNFISVLALLLLAAAPGAFAHVGSPDVYLESDAGPYHLLVTVAPPAMVPGIAQVWVRVVSGTVTRISLVPVYITGGKDQGLPPAPDVMLSVPGDPQSFTGKVWLMASGSWEVRAEVEGSQGAARLAVPVPAFARRTLPMQKGVGVLLLGLMVFLSVGIVAIAGAAAREGVLKPAEAPSASRKRLGRVAMVLAAVAVLGILALGNWWWNLEAASLKQRMLYTAPPLATSLENGNQLDLRIGDDSWHQLRKDDWSMNLIPDHGHLVHAFLLRIPAMDRFYHLHPELASNGSFRVGLPSLPAGRYQIFADIVRGSGFPETMVAEITLPDVAGRPFTGDDSGVEAPVFSAAGVSAASAADTTSLLPDGTRMVCRSGCTGLRAGQLSWLRFRVEDPHGNPVSGLEPYMGMAGHAEFVRSDRSVFAHIHPAGSVPMASLAMVQQGSSAAMDHSAMQTAPEHGLPAEVSFPYAFPQSGEYRLFIQTKRQGQIQTGVFNVHVAG